MSKVAIIGNGNVGMHLASQISKTHDVSIFTRRESKNTLPIESLQAVEFEFIILAVPDDAIKPLANDLAPNTQSVFIHTSGTRPLSDLSRHTKTGVIYPLQTFSKGKSIDFDTIPIFIEGSNDSLNKIASLAKSIGKDVRKMNSADRSKLHLAAVFACNFTNHLFSISDKILSDIDMEIKDLQHLILETVQKAMLSSPANVQTGPAIRGDGKTIANHIEIIEDHDWKEIYKLMSENIRKSHT